jgi:tol-pal system protein YbgF
MNTFCKSAITAAFLAAFSFAPLHARAGLFDDDEARRAILEIRNKVDTLQRDMNARLDTKTDKTGTVDLVNQNEQLHQELAKLRGQIEMLTNELANAQQRQRDFYVDLDNRLRKIEPQKVTVDGKEADIDPAEQKAYDAAQALYKSGDYKNASTAFFEFLRRFPASEYAPTAQYLLGTAYYAQRDYRNAITAQQAVVKNYPDSSKAADALLNIASCQVELKEKSSAKKTLESLLAKYPESTAVPTAKERLAALK